LAKVYISLGSNINPQKNILEALQLLAKYTQLIKVSTVYNTEPIGAKPQSKYYNCVVQVETDIEPRTLKYDILRVIEDKLGRKRESYKFAPRTIDLDILVYEELFISTSDLEIPDPEIMTRSFLALGLYELDPTLILRNVNIPLKKVADQFKNNKINPVTEYSEILKKFVRKI
jgi:2-amino-4-hydroxy-6-hydroxymethyldihydropteridine diphosphokinase